MEYIILIVSLLLNVILSIAFYFIYRKNAFIENIFRVTRQRINLAYMKLLTVDQAGTFEVDDEVGYVYKMIKLIVVELNELIQPSENTNDQTRQNTDNGQNTERLYTTSNGEKQKKTSKWDVFYKKN